MRAHGERQSRLGHGQVDCGSRFNGARDLVGPSADLVAERVEDAVDLVLLVELSLPPAVVQFDDLKRLDEERLAARRGVVDDALELRPGVRAHRHDIAAVPRGDDRVLQHRGVLAPADERVEPLHQPAMGDPHVAPDPAKLGAGGVQNVPAGTNGTVDVGLEIRQLGQMVGELAQVGKSCLDLRQPQKRAAQIPRRRDHVEHLEQLCRLQPGSLCRPLDQIPHIARAADGDVGELGQKIDGLGGDFEQVRDRRYVAARTQLARLLGGDAETTLLPKAIQDRRIFELGENVLMHEERSPNATDAIRLSVAPESRPLA